MEPSCYSLVRVFRCPQARCVVSVDVSVSVSVSADSISAAAAAAELLNRELLFSGTIQVSVNVNREYECIHLMIVVTFLRRRRRRYDLIIISS